MLLNCDLGESFGAWSMGLDHEVMPLIDMANVACGFHASDPLIMHNTLMLAKNHKVKIGAHPAYPDLVGFGRRTIKCTKDELKTMIWYQIGALQGIAKPLGLSVSYVKPHGAMNNDMMANADQLRTIMAAVYAFDPELPLMIPITLDYPAHQKMAAEIGVKIILEAFADRAYDDNGRLVSRALPGAVHHDTDIIAAQAKSFAQRGGLHSINGNWLELPAESLCVHGDNAESVAAVAAIKAALEYQQ